MLTDDGGSAGLDANRLPLAIGTAGGWYPGVSDGGTDDFSMSASPSGRAGPLAVGPAAPTSLRETCFGAAAAGFPNESFRRGGLGRCVPAGDDCDVGESVGARSWVFGSWAARGDPWSDFTGRGDSGDSLVGSTGGSSFTWVTADAGAEFDVDERDVSSEGENPSDLELRREPDRLLFGTSCSLNGSFRLSPFGRDRDSLGGSRDLSWASEWIEPWARP